ncbi:hypothetical protein NFI96_023036 [Prochilodus magdalenae]|nr:hypothetical protein NFI96_023036 [Prochilodus magdalenae]
MQKQETHTRLTAMLWAVIENRHVSLTWTNQISAQTSASKTLTITSPPAPVSEMERLRVVLITLMCVLISSISGVIVEMRVKPGNDATIYSDCTRRAGYILEWLMKPLDEHQPSLIRLSDPNHPHYSRVWNYTKRRYDLLVKNITESDLGLYYCALIGKKVDTSGGRLLDVYHDGNRTTFLSFLGESVHSDLLVLQIWVSFKNPFPQVLILARSPLHQTVVSAGSCWSVCVLWVFSSPPLMSIISTKAEQKVGDGGGGGGRADGGADGVGDADCAPLDILNSDQKEPTNRTDESSDVCTYSEETHNETKKHIRPPLLTDLTYDLDHVDIRVGVLIASISGLVVEMRVKPGDNATIYCDCPRSARHTVIWLRKSSHKLEPPLIRLTEDSKLPRYSRVWNSSSLTYDLLVEKVTESDLGLYYCALNTSGGRLPDVYYEGNRTTFLSFLGESVHSDLPVLLIWVSFQS